MGRLFDDVYCGDFNQKIADLATLSPENWNFSNETDNGILKNYLQFTYNKLFEENKIFTDKNYGLFNEGTEKVSI